MLLWFSNGLRASESSSAPSSWKCSAWCPFAWESFFPFLFQWVYPWLFVLMFLSSRVLAVFINLKSDGEASRLHFKANISQRHQILYLFTGLLASLFEGALVFCFVFFKNVPEVETRALKSGIKWLDLPVLFRWFHFNCEVEYRWEADKAALEHMANVSL